MIRAFSSTILCANFLRRAQVLSLAAILSFATACSKQSVNFDGADPGTATVEDATLPPEDDAVFDPTYLVNSTLTISNTSIVVTTSTEVQLTIRDAVSAPVDDDGFVVGFYATGGTSQVTMGPTLYKGNGVYAAQILGTQAGNVTQIKASISGAVLAAAQPLTVTVPPPDILAYTFNPVVYTKDVAIIANSPSLAGGAVDLFQLVAPGPLTLPAGLSLNPLTGVITGTPTVLDVAGTTYTVEASNTGGVDTFNIQITIVDQIPNITYLPNSHTFVLGSPVAISPASNTGGTVTGCSSAPPLPAGLIFSGGNSTSGLNCDITSASAGPITAPAGTYMITASNSGGSQAAIPLQIRINDVPPSGCTYATTPAVYTRGSAIATNSVTCGGGGPPAAWGSTLAYTISPSFPGSTLSFSTTTGDVTGTPGIIYPLSNYTVTVSNSGGSTTAPLTITINDIPPTISWTGNPGENAGNPIILVRNGSAITPFVPPNVGGGPITSCADTTVLPAGLDVTGMTNCQITGTPTALATVASYTITATNSGGSFPGTLWLKVVDPIPNFSYAASTIIKDSPATINPGANSGGAITACDFNPPGSGPPGLTVAPTTCVISGTPTVAQAATVYNLMASNSGGNFPVTANITVIDLAPVPSFAGQPGENAGNPLILSKGAPAMTPVLASNTGGTPTSCTSFPVGSMETALNGGIGTIAVSVSGTTCQITGYPDVLNGAPVAYTIRGTNLAGSNDATIWIRVIDRPPVVANWSHTFMNGTASNSVVPTNTGGAITGCTNVPAALPAGFTVNTTSCRIEYDGSPTALMLTPQTFTVQATNSGGMDSADISMTVVDALPVITTSPATLTLTRTVPMANWLPTNTGGAITSCTIAPAVPGLTYNTSTCQISGTPTTLNPAGTMVTITPTNSGGTGTAHNMNIVVNDVAPIITFPSVYTLTVGSGASLPINSLNSGGPATGCSDFGGTLAPLGLTVSAVGGVCRISGPPTAASVMTPHTVRGTNSGGNFDTIVVIVVNNIAPVIGSYAGPHVLTKNSGAGLPIAPASLTGGTPLINCTASPSLPTGLSIDPSTCAITGPATVPQVPAVVHTITGMTLGGATGTQTVSIRVNDVAPVLNYAAGPFTYTRNSAIATLSAVPTGGAITNCTVSPALPAGLSIDALTCDITGTPTASQASTAYTVTATSAGGATGTDTFNIIVNDIAPAISYAGSPYTFTRGTAITTITPTLGGGAVTGCVDVGGLILAQTGLTLNSDCSISGTPTVVQVPGTAFSVTPSSFGGATQAGLTVNIRVNDMAPAISFSASYTRTVGPIAAITPTAGGGTVISCTNATLTADTGLTLNSDCSVTGTATTAIPLTPYLLVATSTGGLTQNVTLSLQINNVAPVIGSYGGPHTFTKNSAAGLPISPASLTGGTPLTNCTASPSLPTGLSINPTTCVISGTPTAVQFPAVV
ncbi:MAG: putative Ig domain-containing protein, partial [Bdellovibrionales bacterium]|nr:putative Ig domain-containing protein [Bdellovibrionales bacterium]